MFARVLEHTSEPADKPEAFRDYLGDNDPMADPKGTIPLPPRARLFTARQAIDVALESYRGSRLTEARGILQKVVDAEPGHGFAHHLLGVIAYRMGEMENALEFFRRAIERDPNLAAAHGNLALVLLGTNRLVEAQRSCRRALELQPDSSEFHNTLGMILAALGRSDEAERCYSEAIRINEAFPEAHNNIASLLIKNDRRADAEKHLRRSIELVPDDTLILNNLASILIQMDRREEAIGVLKDMCRLDPDDVHGQSLRLAYLGAAPPPKTRSSRYLNDLYKKRSAHWDRKMDGGPYRAPDLVVDMASRIGGGLGGLDVLDAGCGTGFIGDLLGGECRRLVGVDLSPEMLAVADGKGAYDRLVCADLIDYMKEHPNTFDAVVSAATLIHFGDLRPVFSAAWKTLKQNGIFVFTAFPFEGEGVGVNALMFYAHSEDYVASTAGGAGFEVIAIDRQVQEYEKPDGRPVECLVVGLRRRGRRRGRRSKANA